ncbi:MAG: TIGR03067 domain-containing protein [Gemmataceae bacterium]|nr:TIGR03067 domain-containing protein [Gemmataceae bacterium]
MFTAIVALALAAPADGPDADLPPEAVKELKKLEGKWQLVKLGRDGKETEFPADGNKLVGEFKGPKWFLGKDEKGSVVALESVNGVHLIDMRSSEPGRNGAVDQGIYKLDGDTLTLVVNQGKRKVRPTGFDTPTDKDVILAVMKRVKD